MKNKKKIIVVFSIIIGLLIVIILYKNQQSNKELLNKQQYSIVKNERNNYTVLFVDNDRSTYMYNNEDNNIYSVDKEGSKPNKLYDNVTPLLNEFDENGWIISNNTKENYLKCINLLTKKEITIPCNYSKFVDDSLIQIYQDNVALIESDGIKKFLKVYDLNNGTLIKSKNLDNRIISNLDFYENKVVYNVVKDKEILNVYYDIDKDEEKIIATGYDDLFLYKDNILLCKSNQSEEIYDVYNVVNNKIDSIGKFESEKFDNKYVKSGKYIYSTINRSKYMNLEDFKLAFIKDETINTILNNSIISTNNTTKEISLKTL
ncbi:hypothetical protein K5V21_09135 [Clostridium sardiniense]|uniref:DUF5050 domain-containing protein n=1 Tax=Clostridium sardiniense TaxID=29369 RepID=A0ABS7KXS6_CLOSR|nr:hypothetical protein [Clostridium sardiniense]MBY0755623.1 hypothetical protein [Clostridium sardiniense]MDQ0461793.1 hypothetical protein [Clostridium sardiniense]